MFSLSAPLSLSTGRMKYRLIWQLNKYELLKCESSACVNRPGPFVVVWIISLLRRLANVAIK